MQIQFCMCMEFIVSNPANQSEKYVVVFGVCALLSPTPPPLSPTTIDTPNNSFLAITNESCFYCLLLIFSP